MPNGKNFYFRVSTEGERGGDKRRERVDINLKFQVNSIPIFAKGANWIPADAFESRSTPEVLQNLLKVSFFLYFLFFLAYSLFFFYFVLSFVFIFETECSASEYECHQDLGRRRVPAFCLLRHR